MKHGDRVQHTKLKDYGTVVMEGETYERNKSIPDLILVEWDSGVRAWCGKLHLYIIDKYE